MFSELKVKEKEPENHYKPTGQIANLELFEFQNPEHPKSILIF
jgi:hypothetical protein